VGITKTEQVMNKFHHIYIKTEEINNETLTYQALFIDKEKPK
jgi:hypothetical protein